MIQKKRLIQLTQDLVRINSENPNGNEQAIAKFVSQYLARLGVRVRLHEFKKNHPNVLAYLGTSGSAPKLLVTPHLDTVPAGKSWKKDPFAATVERGRIYGLGATDCKGNLACAIEAIHSIIEDGVRLGYTLVFAATADEESGSELGLIPLLKENMLPVDAAVVLDSDDFDIVVAQKGLMHLKYIITGRRAHGAYPWRGTNAIDIVMRSLRDIKELQLGVLSHKYLRPPTVNVGTIHGGDKVNIVADWCEIELDIRYLPGTSADMLLKKITQAFRKYARHCRVEIEGIQKPYELSETHPLVQGLVRAVQSVGMRARIRGSEGATVITFFQDKKIPAVAFGFGCGGCAHIADEYAEIKNLYKGAQTLDIFLRNYTFTKGTYGRH